MRFAEREGYDVKYSTNIDTHVAPAQILNQRLFLSIGHDEYYSKEMYDGLQAARDAGVNLAFLGANAIYWQIRLAPSTLTGQANRTMIAYKYSLDPIQSTNPNLATYRWRSSLINRSEDRLIGVLYDYNSVDLDMVVADCSSWVCSGTNLYTGDKLAGMLGYEVDTLGANSPAGITAIATSPYDACLNSTCNAKQRRYSNATLYTTPGGARVFASGSMQWNWGLDAYASGERPDRSNGAVQQMTRNILSRFTAITTPSAPRITSTAIGTAALGVGYGYDVNAVDANADTLTYMLQQAPAGMSINATTGVINWLPATTQLGTQNVTVQVRDPGGLTATENFTIEVTVPATTRVDLAGSTIYSGRAGTPVAITLNWYRKPMASNYLQFMHLVSNSGQSSTVDDHSTTSATWSTGIFSEVRTITVPAALSRGTYDIRVGLAGGTPFANVPLIMGAGVSNFGTSNRYKVSTLVVGSAPQITSTAVLTAKVDDRYRYDVVASDLDGDVLSYSLTESPSGMAISTAGRIDWTPAPNQVGQNPVTVRVTDPSGLTASQRFFVDVKLNTAPVIVSTPVLIASVGHPYVYSMIATDADNDPLSYVLTEGPSGMQVDQATGAVNWTPLLVDVGLENVTVRVNDPAGMATTQSFIIVVSPNGQPQILSTPPSSVEAGTLYSYQVVASDSDGDPLSYELPQAPSGMTINAVSGHITWTPLAAQRGGHAVSVRVTDPFGGIQIQNFTLTVNANVAPQITSTAQLTAAAGSPYSYSVQAYDADGDTMTFALDLAPSGMAINPSTGLINWAPTLDQAGSHEVTLRVSDPAGLFATQSYTLTVGANRAPQINSVPIVFAQLGTAYSYASSASDADSDTLTYTLDLAPSGMAINPNTGLINWAPTLDQAGSHAVTLRVSDPAGLSATQSYTLTVSANRAPQINSVPIVFAQAGTAYSYASNASDADGDTLTYTLDLAPSGMAINPSTGLINWAPTLDQAGSHEVTLRVSDPAGLSATQSYTLTVSANRAPQINSVPIVFAQAGTAYSYASNASDADGDTLTFALDLEPSGMAINPSTGLIDWAPTLDQAGSHEVTLRVSDPAGLFATQSYTLTVSGNRAPVYTSTPITDAQIGTGYTYTATATDPDGDTLSFSLLVGPSAMVIDASSGQIDWTPVRGQSGDQVVTVSVSDSHDSVSQGFTVVVAESPPPSSESRQVPLAGPWALCILALVCGAIGLRSHK